MLEENALNVHLPDEMIRILNKSKKINWMEYTQEHLEEDELAIQKYLDGANE